jgi:PASTA domain
MVGSLAITFVLGLVIGVTTGGSGSGSNEIKATLASVEEKAAADALTASESLSSIEASKSLLQAEVDDLSSENSDLSLEITRLNAKREMPSLIGLDDERAFELEDKFGWAISVERRFSDAPAGSITDQSPVAGTMMRYGAPFKVVVAKTIPIVPSVSGLTRGVAVERIRSGGWNVVFVEQISEGTPGRVIGVSPSIGSSLLPGETVTLTISKKAPPPPPEPKIEESSTSGCTPGYSPCLPPASDYDCSGGSGDGPKYTGYVSVTGSDPYGLDSDNDGTGCES